MRATEPSAPPPTIGVASAQLPAPGEGAAKGLHGLRVVSFESRRAEEMAALIRRHGGEPIQAPAMREVPLADERDVLTFGEGLLAGDYDVVILLTGVGTRRMLASLSTRWPPADILGALWHVPLVCRGPKPVAALREVGLVPALVVPEPNTWLDLLAALDRALPVEGRRVAIQEYGARNEALLTGLRERGAHVTPVPVYGWALPEDTGPLQAAIRQIAGGEADTALFTSAQQVGNLFRVASEMGQADALRGALRCRVLVASIGPICTEALRMHGIETDLHPEHPKMGHLVAALARQAGTLLQRKRSG